MMFRILLSVALIGFGAFMIIFRRYTAREYARKKNEKWATHIGESEIKQMEAMRIVAGSVFVLVGILTLLNILKFKSL